MASAERRRKHDGSSNRCTEEDEAGAETEQGGRGQSDRYRKRTRSTVDDTAQRRASRERGLPAPGRARKPAPSARAARQGAVPKRLPTQEREPEQAHWQIGAASGWRAKMAFREGAEDVREVGGGAAYPELSAPFPRGGVERLNAVGAGNSATRVEGPCGPAAARSGSETGRCARVRGASPTRAAPGPWASLCQCAGSWRRWRGGRVRDRVGAA